MTAPTRPSEAALAKARQFTRSIAASLCEADGYTVCRMFTRFAHELDAFAQERDLLWSDALNQTPGGPDVAEQFYQRTTDEIKKLEILAQSLTEWVKREQREKREAVEAVLRALEQSMNGLPAGIDPTLDTPPHRIPPHGPSAYAYSMNEWVDAIESLANNLDRLACRPIGETLRRVRGESECDCGFPHGTEDPHD